MTKLQQNESGFSAVELVLILVVVAIIGFTGWFVYHGSKSANSAIGNTNKVAKGSSAPTTAGTPSKRQTLAIKEWGVQASFNGKQTLTYSVSNSINTGVEYAAINSSQLTKTAQYPDCAKDGEGGAIGRAKTGTTIDMVGSTVLAQNYPDAKRIGDYYYWYEGNQDPHSCGDKSATFQEQIEAEGKLAFGALQSAN